MKTHDHISKRRKKWLTKPNPRISHTIFQKFGGVKQDHIRQLSEKGLTEINFIAVVADESGPREQNWVTPKEVHSLFICSNASPWLVSTGPFLTLVKTANF